MSGDEEGWAIDANGWADERAIGSQLRARNLRTIEAHYGTEEGVGLELLLEVAAKHLLAMLPDEAIAELAERHRNHQERGHRP